MGYLLAALASGLLFFNVATPDRAARGMEKELRKRYPNSQIRVQVEARRGPNVLHGKFKKVSVQMTGSARATTLTNEVAPVWSTRATEALTNNAAATEESAPRELENNASATNASATNASAKSDGFIPIAAVDKAKSAGKIGQVSMQLRDFDLNGLRVESADVNWRNITYDWDALRKSSKLNLVTAGPANAHIVVPVASLQTLILQRLKDVQNPKVSLQNGRFLVSGTRPAPFFGIQLPFTLSAKPIVKSGTEIWLDDVQATLSGAPLPASLVNGLVKDFNPVYKFALSEQWPFTVNITGLQAQNDKLALDAQLTFVPTPLNAPANAAANANAPISSTRNPAPKPSATPYATPKPIPTPIPSATPTLSLQPA